MQPLAGNEAQRHHLSDEGSDKLGAGLSGNLLARNVERVELVDGDAVLVEDHVFTLESWAASNNRPSPTPPKLGREREKDDACPID